MPVAPIHGDTVAVGQALGDVGDKDFSPAIGQFVGEGGVRCPAANGTAAEFALSGTSLRHRLGLGGAVPQLLPVDEIYGGADGKRNAIGAAVGSGL